MAKEVEPLMTPAEMKPLLLLSKRQPVNCAIGLDKEKNGIILLDKKAKPRKMLALIKKKAKDAEIELNPSSVRFGIAEVDTDVDSRLVKFTVNKEAPGVMNLKLLALLKKAGFGKCDIVVDEKLEEEPEDEGEEEAAPEGPVAKGPQAPGGDIAELSKKLTDLVKKMMTLLGSNPPGADAMKTAAMAGQAAIKKNDAATAKSSVETLERLMNAAGQGGQAGGQAAGKGSAKNPPGSPVFKTAQATWVATRKRVEDELAKLHKELQATYKDHPVGGEIESVFQKKVGPMLDNFDHSLTQKLDEVQKVTEAAAHGKLVDEAKAIIAKYQSYLGSEKLIAQLDDNPFVPLTIQKTLTASLTQLAKSVT